MEHHEGARMRDQQQPEPIPVVEKCCGECLFSNNRLVSETEAARMVERIQQDGSYFECHKVSVHRGDVLHDEKWGDDHAAAVEAARKVQGCCHAYYKKFLAGKQAKFVALPDVVSDPAFLHAPAWAMDQNNRDEQDELDAP